MTNPINPQTEAAAVAELVKHHQDVKLKTLTSPDGSKKAEVLVVPEGMKVESVKRFLDEYLTAPERRKGMANLTELESFIAHVKRFMDEDTALFADRTPTAPSLVAVFDYHLAGADGAPRFGTHRARYAFPLSDPWLAWTKANGVSMAQAQFAAFLEDRIADVLDPMGDSAKLESTRAAMEALLTTFASPSRLIDLARGLTVRVESIVANAQNLKNGESTLRFETTHQDERGAPLDVPGAFLIGVPVFRGGDRFSIPARLRYRIKEGRVTWSYDLYRATETFDLAFGEACTRAQKETEAPLFFGTPEA